MSDLENSNLQPNTASPDASTLDTSTLDEVYGGGKLLDILKGDLKWCSHCNAFNRVVGDCDVCGDKWCGNCIGKYGYGSNVCYSCAKVAKDTMPYTTVGLEKLQNSANAYKLTERPCGWGEFFKETYWYIH